jgi:hypothetical protein
VVAGALLLAASGAPLGITGPEVAASPREVPSIAPLDEEPEVVAALERLDAAWTALDAAEVAAEVAAGAIDGAERAAATTAADLAALDQQVDELGGRVDEAFERHAENRRSYVDAAVAAYVAGVPDSMQLRAALLEDPTERTHSLALAQSVGDVFADRAARYRQSGESLDGDLRVLAEEQAAARRAAEEAAASSAQARSALEAATVAVAEAVEEVSASEQNVEAARD